MSVGVDTNAINLSGPWNPSPPPKLTTPLLAVDAVPSTVDWTNPLSATPFSANPHGYPSSTPIQGFTPRFSPTFNSLTSPGGVSADIANITDPAIPSTSSIADLFASPEYPLTPVSSAKLSHSRSNDPRSATFRTKPPTAPISSSKPLQQQQPVISSAQPIQPASQPIPHSNNQTQSYPLPHTNPQSYPTSSTAPNLIHTPTYHQLPTSQPISQSYQQYPKHSHPIPINPTQQPVQPIPSQPQPAPIQPNTQPPPPQMQPAMSMPQPVVSSLAPSTNNVPYVTSNNMSVSTAGTTNQLGSTYPFPNTGPGGATSLGTTSTLTPSMSDQMKGMDDKQPGRFPGHRSVLGSGISSSAVREAQARARIKADDFAKQRKRQRGTETTVVQKKVEKEEDDSKLSPNDLKQKRYKRRLALNRESAAVSRVRRKEYVKLLEEKLVTAEEERIKLMSELIQMRKEHDRLRGYLCKLEEKPDDGTEN